MDLSVWVYSPMADVTNMAFFDGFCVSLLETTPTTHLA